MAGVLLHLAMGDPEKTDPENSHYSSSFKKAYTLGLLLPDIAKRDFIGNEEEFNRFFEGCSRDDILAYEEYQRMRTRIELLEILAESEEDVKKGRVAPIQDTFQELRQLLVGDKP